MVLLLSIYCLGFGLCTYKLMKIEMEVEESWQHGLLIAGALSILWPLYLIILCLSFFGNFRASIDDDNKDIH